MKRFFIALFVILTSTFAQAETKKGPGPPFHDQVVTTYNFLPRNLNEKGIDAKSKEQANLRHKGPR